MRARGVFVTSTDAGTGSTFAACALLHALRAAGLRASGMKPVAIGCNETAAGLRSHDALALTAASDPPPPSYAACNPFALRAAVPPHIAAAEMHLEVTMPPVEDAYDAITIDTETVVVEGIGGWLTPLSICLRSKSIAQQLDLPVILVVGLERGCLNHAQVTARAIRSDECELIGWIGNRIDPDLARPKEHLAYLQRVLPAPCIGILPHGIDPVAGAACLRDAADLIEALRA